MRRLLNKWHSGFVSSKIGIASLLVLFLITLFSCKKEDLNGLFKSTGSNVTIERDASQPFHRIYLNDDINLVLTQGSGYRITLEGGENMLPGIVTSVDSNTLVISNTNKFNWTRSYNRKITAYVTLTDLSELTYNATSRVSCTDTIRNYDSITVLAVGGSGYIDLTVSAIKTKLAIFKGCSADMKIKGFSGESFLYTAGYGLLACDSLNSTLVFMRSLSSNNCYIRFSRRLEYELMGIGDIWYYGPSYGVAGNITGSGMLIKKGD